MRITGCKGNGLMLVHTEHLLGLSASWPEKTHVPGFALLELHVVVDNTVGCGVIGLDGCLSLRVAHLD